jgi:hypothetical protein
MNALIGALFLVGGLVGTFRTDLMGTFKNDRNKKLCRLCCVGILLCGILILALDFFDRSRQ